MKVGDLVKVKTVEEQPVGIIIDFKTTIVIFMWHIFMNIIYVHFQTWCVESETRI